MSMNPSRLKKQPRPALSGGGVGGSAPVRGSVPSPAPAVPVAPSGAGGVELVGGLDPLTAELVGQAPELRPISSASNLASNKPAPTTDQPQTMPLRGSTVSGSSRASVYLLPLGLAAAGTVAAFFLLASGRKPRGAGPARPPAQLGGMSPTTPAPIQNIPFQTAQIENPANFGTLAGGGK